MQKVHEGWSVAKAAATYGIKEWGAGYFDLSESGEVVVKHHNGSAETETSLLDIVRGVEARGLGMPVLIRIENILQRQMTRLHESFTRAMADHGYTGGYQGVFPIKTNQQAQVIEEVSSFGATLGHGLEAGSKAELMIALSMIESSNGPIVCNGYKDPEFIDLGLQTTRMGYHVFFVIEMPSELGLILERSRALGIEPMIGVRIKLSSNSEGRWQDSGGDQSIFGLTTSQLVELLDELKAADMLHCFRLLHYHLGSQIPNIRDIRTATREASRFYADLVREGAPLGYLDLGGGLGVDYDGSQTSSIYSKNYSLDEYAADVTDVLATVLGEHCIEHPTIITESGRATVAYSSILVFDVLDVTPYEAGEIPTPEPEGNPEPIRNLYEVREMLGVRDTQECYNDAIYYREEARQEFEHGKLTMRDRALAENLFVDVVHSIGRLLSEADRIPRELEGLSESLYDIYYGNFSVFQSLPDVWAIDQIFPVMPIHRLNTEPERRAIIADITCDSDGKIARFCGGDDARRSMPVHRLKPDDDYYLGVFLVGAYQETLGDLHNLLGDTHVVSVRIDGQGDFEFVREIKGDSVGDVLSYVEYQPAALVERFRHKAERAVRDGRITVAERRRLVQAYEAGIRGYTYCKR